MGTTRSNDFPTTEGAYQRERRGRSDIYVTKIDREGKPMVYSTLLGESDEDAHAVAVDREGDVYVAGLSLSASYPGFVSHSAGEVVTKLRADGRAVLFPVTIGGRIAAMATDTAGSEYFCGAAGAGHLAVTPGAFQPVAGGSSAGFAGKLNSTGQFVYASYLGGASSGSDQAQSISVDGQGNAYVAGSAFSPDFSTKKGAFQENFGATMCSNLPCSRGFAAKINP